MKYYTFYRENNNFGDILADPMVKKIADMKISWYCYLLIGISDTPENEQSFSMITLKYGDDMVNNLTKDFTPIAGVDYVPKKDKTKFTKVTE
jgi:hypothetical protein